MPRSIADARKKVSILLDGVPADLPTTGAVIPAALLNSDDATCNIAKNDFRMSATASESINDPRLCDEGNASVLGASNYEASWSIFRYFDEDGQVDPDEDWLFDLVRAKGATVVAALRENGRMYDQEWQEGEEGELWVMKNDNPQRPTDTGGYIKRVTPFAVERVVPFTVGTA